MGGGGGEEKAPPLKASVEPDPAKQNSTSSTINPDPMQNVGGSSGSGQNAGGQLTIEWE